MVESDCVDDGNNIGYVMACDNDVNEYDTGDVQDLTLASIGEFGRAVGIFVSLLVLLLIIGFIVKWIMERKKDVATIAK